jgi:hypothetical protein
MADARAYSACDFTNRVLRLFKVLGRYSDMMTLG